MTIVKVNKDDVETFTLVTTPRRFYVSGSSGVSGSVKVFPRESSTEKEMNPPRRVFDDVSGKSNSHVDANFSSVEKNIQLLAKSRLSQKKSMLDLATKYVNLVNNTSLKQNQVLNVERFTPTTKVTKYTLAKNNVKDILMPFYRTIYPHADWAYTNYNSLNFFTVSTGSLSIPTSSVLLYPNVNDPEVSTAQGRYSGSYCLSGAFSFDFHINPRYKVDGIDEGHFKAGTLLHLSSSYAISLITGSEKDADGLPLGYRLQLQLSHSADIPPSLAIPGTYPNDLVFLSDDNSLKWNNWHHVVVRWGTNKINKGTGSFVIDGTTRGEFNVPSSSITPFVSDTNLEPDVLCIGNYFEGKNISSDSQSLFFNAEHSKRDGVVQLTSVDGEYPNSDTCFNHPLKAEIHDLCIRRYYMNPVQISSSFVNGIDADEVFDKSKFAFYLPPYFVQQSPIRRFVNGSGGIPQTPFFSIDGTTDDPFNVSLSFGVNGHYINLENFVKDFSTSNFPRLYHLTASLIDYTTEAKEANTFLYTGSSGIAKRNLTVLPCDDGRYEPNYSVLLREKYSNKYVDSAGTEEPSYISLENLINQSGYGVGRTDPDSTSGGASMNEELIGPTPEKPFNPPGKALLKAISVVSSSLSTDEANFDRGVQKNLPLTIFQRTLDPSSNQVTFFNISNLYYGTKIMPGSFTITDTAISGSEGAVKITLKDDGSGNLYRADASTVHAKHSTTVGNIFYDEGLLVIKSPHLYFFGKNQYEISFKGLKTVYSTKYEILAGKGMLNSSSNPTYLRSVNEMSASSDITDTDSFVYISGINLHDENMNVVAKAKLAQPIIKRERDKVLFKVAFDF